MENINNFNFFVNLFDSNQAPMLIIDSNTLNIKYSNSTAVALYGYNSQELNNIKFNILRNDSLENVRYDFKRLESEKKNFNQKRHIRKNGSSVNIIENFQIFLQDETKYIFIIINEFDSLWQEESKNELTRAREYFELLYQDFPALIWRAKTDKLCDYFNKPWLEFTGRELSQEIGNGWTEGVHPDDFQNCLDIYVQSFDKRERFEMDYRIKHNSGEYRWIKDIGSPLYDINGTFIGYIGSCFDITKDKNYEERLKELNNSKDKFFSLIAHELKSPVSAFINLSEILKDDSENMQINEINEISSALHNSANAVFHLLDDLLKWSLSETGKIPFNRENININEIVFECFDQLSKNANLKNTELQTSLTSEIWLNADKNMIQTVFRNLIGNAIKFTENGLISVDHLYDNGIYHFSVKDNGVGIDSERMGKMFILQSELSTLGTRKEKGTGLGLILCKEFIQKHGGKIWVESEIGKGTTIHFTLPKN